MSLSTQLLQFLGVAFVFVAFTFAWGWYIGRRDDGTGERPEPEPEATDARGES